MDSTRELVNKIEKLKKESNAVILVHNYQINEVQEIADYLGDSLDLARKAAELDHDVIVFCGVTFMGETAAILSPSKTVLVPDINAGCPLADMITPEKLMDIKLRKPGAAVVCYVNSSAEVKALSDICCTSANAVDIVNSLEEHDVIFIPDRNLASYVARNTKKKIILYNGYCPTHHRVLLEDLIKVQKLYPGAKTLVHPECPKEICDHADFIGGTNDIIKYAKNSNDKKFIIGTECGILHRLKRENPDKEFYIASQDLICPNMKLTNLEKIYWCLENKEPVIRVPEHISERARLPIEKMLAVSKNINQKSKSKS
ncbi:MAG: quinolinate synthase NadA [Armatimonadota bacterium]